MYLLYLDDSGSVANLNEDLSLLGILPNTFSDVIINMEAMWYVNQ
jgi:hypothetical protein